MLDGVKRTWDAEAMVAGGSARSARDRLLDAAAEEVAAAAGPGQVSLRAIARRAGLSHNAAEYHFQDRAGLLTAPAVNGFHRLEGDLRRALDAANQTGVDPLTALGGAYLDFGLTDPNTLELMFRSDLVRPQDPDLAVAQRRAFGVLEEVATKAAGTVPAGREGDLPAIAWAFVHGLVGLVRYGALRPAEAPSDPGQTEQMARNLVATFTGLLRADGTTPTAPPIPDSRR
jgi:AcrR family transcriptional regulator